MRAWARWRNCGSNISQRLRPSRRASNIATRASRKSSVAMVWGLVQRAIPAQALMETCEFSRLKGRAREDRRVLGEGLRLLYRRGVQQEGEFVASHARQRARGMDRGFRDDSAETGRGFDQAPDRPRDVPDYRSSSGSHPDRAATRSRILPGLCRASAASRWLRNMVRLPSPVSGSSSRLSRSA